VKAEGTGGEREDDITDNFNIWKQSFCFFLFFSLGDMCYLVGPLFLTLSPSRLGL